MKTPSRGVPGGFALVIVLSFLVLLVVVVMAFFSSVTSEYRSTKTFSNQVVSKQLADSVVQMVMAQIKDATSQGSAIAWASQPGMIRTYGDSGGTSGSSALMCYKLYSSGTMQVMGGSFDPADDMDAKWDEKPALFSNLNSSVTDKDGNLCFPILDPRAYTGGTDGVDGFSYSATSSGETVDGVVLPSGGTQKLPMPVKWLYMLKDGTLTAPTGVGTTGSTAVWTGKAAYLTPSATNPIVGRVAFWTDDETCKVNINTAGEGVYWDTPRYGGTTLGKGKEIDYSVYQPTLYEFQRYPGHPAGVALSPVLKVLTGVSGTAELATTVADITPRLAPGGSEGGTIKYTDAAAVDWSKAARQALYTSVDELMFSGSMNGTTRVQTSVGSGVFTKGQLEKAGFFLTANSRAPEVNLFGKPRIACWPISSEYISDHSSAKTTAFDRLIAFNSTLRTDLGTAAYPFYFQRAKASSSVSDYADISRNQKLYSYLQTLTSSANPIPGFGGSFQGKYGDDRDQILTEIFDYIRSANLYDNMLSSGDQFNSVGDGVVAPIKIGSTKGFGRQYMLSEVGLWLVCTGTTATTGTYQAALILEGFNPAMGPARDGHIDEVFQTKGLQDVVFRSTGRGASSFQPFANISDSFSPSSYSTSNPGNLKVAYTSIRAWAPELPPIFMMDQGAQRGHYPYISNTFEVPLDRTFRMDAFTLTIKAYEGKQGATSGLDSIVTDENLLQTYQLDFPAMTSLPLPEYSGTTNIQQRLDSAGTGDPTTTSDVIQTMFPASGDMRLVMASGTVATGASGGNFTTRSDYGTTAMSHYLVSTNDRATCGDFVANDTAVTPDVPAGTESGNAKYGDWDTGAGWYADSVGAFINKPDDGDHQTGDHYPYYWLGTINTTGTTFYTPNRNMPSPGMFGSLPTGVKSNTPWQTLLFRPSTGSDAHPESVASRPDQPPDHLFMDLFWMPVVEPYAISDSLSTAGKINMNYQIVPFTYIDRNTALVALLKGERMISVPDGVGGDGYKNGANTTAVYRFKIDPGETTGSLRQFKERFDNNQIFKSPTEICDIYLVPGDQEQPSTGHIASPEATVNWSSNSGAESYWSTHQRTGDNSRERVYTTLYPKLTTKSNTYTVHYRVQSLQKVPSTNAAQWVEGKDQVTGEMRGSSMIERYIDPTDSSLPDFATASGTTTLDSHYRFHVLSSKRFDP